MTPNFPGQSPPGEKAAFQSHQTPRGRRHIVKKMPSARHFFLTLLLGLIVTAGFANALLKQQPPNESQAESTSNRAAHRDDSTFSRLLSSASPHALHHFLHAYFPATYKHGVYNSDHAAMEAVHANDPELATSIVQMAKRQQSGNDTTAAVPSSTSTEPSATTSTTESTMTQESTAETTSTVPSSTSTSDTSTSIATSTGPTQTESQTTTTAPESTETTSTPGSTLATTTTSSAGTTVSPRTSTFTSTLPGGAKTTITSVEVVTPGVSEAASTTSGTSGSLQSGVGRPLAVNPMVEVVIGVIVGGALLV